MKNGIRKDWKSDCFRFFSVFFSIVIHISFNLKQRAVDRCIRLSWFNQSLEGTFQNNVQEIILVAVDIGYILFINKSNSA